MVWSARETHRTRLRPLISLFFHEPYLSADVELVETGIKHAVTMKINLPSVGGVDEPVPLVRKEFGDFPNGRSHMCLDVTAMFAHVILKAPPHRVKRIANRDEQIFIRLVIHDQFATGHGEVEAHVEGTATTVVPAWCFHDDAAAQDAVVIGIEPVSVFAHLGFYTW